MKILNILIFIFLIIGSNIFCGDLSARYRLKKGKAEEYFTGVATIELVKAAEKGNIKKIDEALAKGVNINQVGKEEFTPLLWVLSKLNKKGFEYLLEKGADPNYRDKDGYSVMYFATIYKDNFYLEKALQFGGVPNLLGANKFDQTIIFEAIHIRRIANIKLLIKAGADLNHQDVTKFTPMMEAAVFSSYDIIYLLLEAGADPLLKNKFGNTILWTIERNKINFRHPMYQWYKKVVELLRSRGIEVNVEL